MGGEDRAYQAAGGVDACVTRPGAVKPFGLAEFPKAFFRHCVCILVCFWGVCEVCRFLICDPAWWPLLSIDSFSRSSVGRSGS